MMSGVRDRLRIEADKLRASDTAATFSGFCAGYRPLAKLLSDFSNLPDFVEVHVDAETSNSRPVVRLELTTGDVVRDAEVSVLTGGIHAMEWIGVEVAWAAFLKLVEARREGKLARRVVYYPLLNPDGYANAEADLLTDRFHYRRANARGVDLNRNWPVHWSSKVALTRRLFPEGGHGGSSPASECEVAAVIAHVDTLRSSGAKIVRAAALHSFGGVILVPPGTGKIEPGTENEVAKHRAHAEAIAAQMKRPYKVRIGSWPPGGARGMELDYFASLGAISVLIECGPRGGIELSKPGSWVKPWRWYNVVDAAGEAAEIAPGLVEFLS